MRPWRDENPGAKVCLFNSEPHERRNGKEKKRKEEGIFKGFSFKRKFRDVKRGKLPKAPQPAGSSKAGQSFQHLPRADAFPILYSPASQLSLCHGRTPLPPLPGSPESLTQPRPAKSRTAILHGASNRLGRIEGVHITTIRRPTAAPRKASAHRTRRKRTRTHT